MVLLFCPVSIVEIPAMETESPPPTPPIDENFDEDEDLPDVPGDDDEDDEEEDDDAGDSREPPDGLKLETEKQAAASAEGEKPCCWRLISERKRKNAKAVSPVPLFFMCVPECNIREDLPSASS